MTTRRQHIVDRLKASNPGPTADQVARDLGMSLGAVMNHIKHIRKAHTVIATPHKHDARIKHYRIKPAQGDDAPAQATQPPKAAAQQPAPRQAQRQDLSATELEEAICTALRTHAGPRRPMDMEALCDHVQAPHALVRPAVIALVQRETVTRIKGGYHLPEAARPTLAQAVAGQRVICNASMPTENASWWAKHINTTPPRADAGAMDAYRLPSRGMGV